MDEVAVRRNLYRLQMIRCMTAAFVLFPIFALFFQDRGLSWSQIFLVETLYSMTAALLEVPSGWFSDRFGHKKSVLVGCVAIATGFGLYCISHGFVSLLVAELFVGIGYGFRAGADSALAYESLEAIGQEDEKYRKFETDTQIYSNIGGLVGALLGGVAAASWGLDLVVVFQAVVTLCAVPLACGLKEAPKAVHLAHAAERGSPFGDIKRALKETFRGRPQMRWTVWSIALVAPSLSVGYWLSQPYYQSAGIPIGWFGVLSAVYLGAISLLAIGFRRFHRISSERLLMVSMVVPALAFGALGLGMSVWLIPMMLGFCFLSAVYYPAMLEQVNRTITDSTIRATILSIRTLMGRLMIALVGPIIGWVGDVYSLQTALLSMAVTCTVFGVVIIVGMVRASRYEMATS